MICLTLSSKTLEECRVEVERNRSFISMCELRVDLLEKEEQQRAMLFPSLVDIPVILTLRRTQDGGKCTLSEKDRRALLLSLLDGSFAYVDLEDDVKKSEVDTKAKERGVKIIRSYHSFEGVPSDIYSKVKHLAARGDVAKVACRVNSLADVITLYRIQRELPDGEKIIIGMGEYGVVTRILYKRMGSILTFASESAVAPGQVPARTLKELYRADTITERTHIYGIVGNPVHHSSSPLIHNPGFKAINYDAVYVPVLAESAATFFLFAEMIRIHGFSVTIPFKNEVLSYLGKISREVKQIGACNTVVRVPNMWKGMNTDYYGFLAPIRSDIASQRIKSALVIGAGGASRAVVWALRNMGVKVTILNRTLSSAKELAEVTLSSYDELKNAKSYEGRADLIVQTTSVGLYPHEDANPLEGFKFSGNEIVYDIIYKPKYTRLLKEAERSGCTLHFGAEMLFEQGKLQFEAFTGYHYPSFLDPAL